MAEQTTERPYEAEHRLAVDRFNEAIIAVRVAREMMEEQRRILCSIAWKFYEANPDLPRPE